ncbi:MAG: hypothetical protein P1Q69_06590 [Candidatus Thorarchaeota archaeon]|nr:hypothetical protein [Candidatus Thorarchaeota archaeon]
MTEYSSKKALDILGIDLRDGRSRILRAIVSTQDEKGVGTTFDAMRTKLLEETGGKEIARPLIYRYLKFLEGDGLIVVDRSSAPNQYITNLPVLSRGIEAIRVQHVTKLKENQKSLLATHETVSTLTPSWLARDLIETLLGTRFESGSRSTQGINEIQDLIGSEIYSRAREGDVIRATLDWNFRTKSYEEKNRNIGIALFSKKVLMKFILHNPDYVNQDLLRDRIQEYKRLKSIPEIGKYAESRVTFKTTKTYQAVSLNREGVVLVVSDDPYTAVWIPRSVNSKLVDEIVDRFDEDFDGSTDLVDAELFS